MIINKIKPFVIRALAYIPAIVFVGSIILPFTFSTYNQPRTIFAQLLVEGYIFITLILLTIVFGIFRGIPSFLWEDNKRLINWLRIGDNIAVL